MKINYGPGLDRLGRSLSNVGGLFTSLYEQKAMETLQAIDDKYQGEASLAKAELSKFTAQWMLNPENLKFDEDLTEISERYANDLMTFYDNNVAQTFTTEYGKEMFKTDVVAMESATNGIRALEEAGRFHKKDIEAIALRVIDDASTNPALLFNEAKGMINAQLDVLESRVGVPDIEGRRKAALRTLDDTQIKKSFNEANLDEDTLLEMADALGDSSYDGALMEHSWFKRLHENLSEPYKGTHALKEAIKKATDERDKELTAQAETYVYGKSSVGEWIDIEDMDYLTTQVNHRNLLPMLKVRSRAVDHNDSIVTGAWKDPLDRGFYIDVDEFNAIENPYTRNKFITQSIGNAIKGGMEIEVSAPVSAFTKGVVDYSMDTYRGSGDIRDLAPALLFGNLQMGVPQSRLDVVDGIAEELGFTTEELEEVLEVANEMGISSDDKIAQLRTNQAKVRVVAEETEIPEPQVENIIELAIERGVIEQSPEQPLRLSLALPSLSTAGIDLPEEPLAEETAVEEIVEEPAEDAVASIAEELGTEPEVVQEVLDSVFSTPWLEEPDAMPIQAREEEGTPEKLTYIDIVNKINNGEYAGNIEALKKDIANLPIASQGLMIEAAQNVEAWQKANEGNSLQSLVELENLLDNPDVPKIDYLNAVIQEWRVGNITQEKYNEFWNKASKKKEHPHWSGVEKAIDSFAKKVNASISDVDTIREWAVVTVAENPGILDTREGRAIVTDGIEKTLVGKRMEGLLGLWGDIAYGAGSRGASGKITNDIFQTFISDFYAGKYAPFVDKGTINVLVSSGMYNKKDSEMKDSVAQMLFQKPYKDLGSGYMQNLVDTNVHVAKASVAYKGAIDSIVGVDSKPYYDPVNNRFVYEVGDGVFAYPRNLNPSQAGGADGLDLVLVKPQRNWDNDKKAYHYLWTKTITEDPRDYLPFNEQYVSITLSKDIEKVSNQLTKAYQNIQDTKVVAEKAKAGGFDKKSGGVSGVSLPWGMLRYLGDYDKAVEEAVEDARSLERQLERTKSPQVTYQDIIRSMERTDVWPR